MEDQAKTLIKDDIQLVVFELSGEHYGVDISVVNTIIRMQEITKIPRAPEFVEGVINLRGSIIPVIDLRKRFGLDEAEATKASRIVVAETSNLLIGIVVDAVAETLWVSGEAIEPTSSIVASMDSEYLKGIAKVGEKLIILLELNKILADSERNELQSVEIAA